MHYLNPQESLTAITISYLQMRAFQYKMGDSLKSLSWLVMIPLTPEFVCLAPQLQCQPQKSLCEKSWSLKKNKEKGKGAQNWTVDSTLLFFLLSLGP